MSEATRSNNPRDWIRYIQTHGAQIEDDQRLAKEVLSVSIPPGTEFALRETGIQPSTHNAELRRVLEELGLRSRVLNWCHWALKQEPEIEENNRFGKVHRSFWFQGFSVRSLNFLIELLS